MDKLFQGTCLRFTISYMPTCTEISILSIIPAVHYDFTNTTNMVKMSVCHILSCSKTFLFPSFPNSYYSFYLFILFLDNQTSMFWDFLVLRKLNFAWEKLGKS
uniref:Uncharacterized protein n=1 Tax=Nelumbo nucifera TaxID=4432 RepID=A0A822YAP7_NELNU|nr:TPA_asm: hypothetical protein HUJ06_030651 [Nelumbo nucifera]